jgi:glycosyltransferase involved in cell wall biosynthesis
MIISAFIPVFNEEARIQFALESLMWCDEIVVLDKYSLDNTVKIAKSFGSKVKIVQMENSPNYNSQEWEYMFKETSGEWILRFTASDLIHPKLANEINKLVKDISFRKDVIYVPFNRYVMGVNNRRSPWYSDICPMVFRKSNLGYDPLSVHHSLVYSSNKHIIDLPNKYGMYHLTHESSDRMMERHLRYLRTEAHQGTNKSFFHSFLIVLKEIFKVLFWKKTFLLGWDGIMLSFAYLSYFMMGFVYKWEEKKGNANSKYQSIRNEIHNSWVEYFQNIN